MIFFRLLVQSIQKAGSEALQTNVNSRVLLPENISTPKKLAFREHLTSQHVADQIGFDIRKKPPKSVCRSQFLIFHFFSFIFIQELRVLRGEKLEPRLYLKRIH